MWPVAATQRRECQEGGCEGSAGARGRGFLERGASECLAQQQAEVGSALDMILQVTKRSLEDKTHRTDSPAHRTCTERSGH